MPNYAVARGAVWFLEVLGAIAAAAAVVGAGALAALRPDLADPVIAAIWGGAGLMAGLAAVALAQVVRAMVDMAEHTAELVRLARRGPAAAHAQGGGVGGGAAALVAERPAPTPRAGGRSEPPLTRPGAAG